MKKLKIDFVIPVYNEEKILKNNICKLKDYLKYNKEDKWKIVIAENGSSDKSTEIAKNLAKEYDKVDYVHIKKRGRGYALNNTFKNSGADICFYMDADLSTDLSGIQDAVLSIKRGYDIAIGSRYIKKSGVKRTVKRLILSKIYNLLVWILFKTKIKDMQCGFKAINKKIIREVLPKVKDRNWFFDTELLILSQKRGYKIKEIPVIWKENPNTKVEIVKTIIEYISSLIKLRIRIKNEAALN